jgi:hypothetical protein
MDVRSHSLFDHLIDDATHYTTSNQNESTYCNAIGACVLWYEKKKNQDEDAGISDCINDCTVKKEETVRRTALKEEKERVCSGTVRVMSN